ncbi:hypothetical protein B7435_30300 [Mycolicibacterium peregrinum]|nr:hypothetical protein B7435_30300 [Mycolicibacterium peregrinum]
MYLCCATAVLLASGACSASRDQYSYDRGKAASTHARWIADKHGVSDVREACTRAVKSAFSGQLAHKEVVSGEENPEPDGINLDDAIAGCVDAYQ